MITGASFLDEEDKIAADKPVGHQQVERATRPTCDKRVLTSDLAIWDAGADEAPIPPRGWLLEKVFCRRVVSSTIGDGAVGKTAVRIAQCMALATGKPLTGEHVVQRCRVLLVSLEDDRDELRRRVEAARIHHGIAREELKGWLFLSAPGRKAGKLAVTENGVHQVSVLALGLSEQIIQLSIDVVCIDPLVKSHSLVENDNNAMDFLVEILAELAIEHNCAIDAPHHVSKGPPNPGNADRGRGGSSFKDGARLVYTLTPMSEEEAKLFNLRPEDRRSLIRMDSAKVNIARPSTSAKWFRLVGVALGNGNALYPNGDEVQTIEPWHPPDFWGQISTATANEILTLIDEGMANGQRYSGRPQARERAAWRVVKSVVPSLSDEQARKVIATWMEKGMLEHRAYPDPVRRRDEQGLVVVDAKRPR
jgi:hypothetical protein